MNVLLGPTLVGQDLADAADGGARQADDGPHPLARSGCHRRRVQDRKVAMVYQQFINYPGFTVYENIASPCA
jgi:glycerol transport system ATP-binding protein